MKIAALYVEIDGCYYGNPEIEPWGVDRDARLYRGPFPVIAHPPCQRFGRFAKSHPTKPGAYNPGDDGGCFEAALRAVVNFGGVIEHPAHSLAWKMFGLPKPPKRGWSEPDKNGLRSCQVEQGHYGHFSRKPTWLLAKLNAYPELIWGRAPQVLPQYAIERYGYEKARRIGVMAAVGGKDKTKIRNATPPPFRDLLVSMVAQSEVSQ